MATEGEIRLNMPSEMAHLDMPSEMAHLDSEACANGCPTSRFLNDAIVGIVCPRDQTRDFGRTHGARRFSDSWNDLLFTLYLAGAQALNPWDSQVGNLGIHSHVSEEFDRSEKFEFKCKLRLLIPATS
jgi:hypothetical protein